MTLPRILMHAHLRAHAGTQSHLYTHTPCFEGIAFRLSPLHRLRQRRTMSLCRLSDCSIQVMLPRHFAVCCPTAESSRGFEPKQGVAIPLPARPLLSARRSTAEEQGFKWEGGAVGKLTCRGAIYTAALPFRLQELGEISVQALGAADGGRTLDAPRTAYALPSYTHTTHACNCLLFHFIFHGWEM